MLDINFVDGTEQTANPNGTNAFSQVASLVSMGLKANPVGLALAGVEHFIKATSGKSILTITTENRVYALNNAKDDLLKIVDRSQVGVGKALEKVGLEVLGRIKESEEETPIQPQVQSDLSADKESALGKLRDISLLHDQGILDDEEYRAAKARIIENI
ncbi:SHOCT domain-containing protein [Schaalia sp. ZJ405]|uniref:SHOCT domain-containing protein n=1 Tax=Schaalia sp. ZJ405 TaxID=2709403 RepID=UPI0013EB9110|nr:SHOCT domain-containing protein [Schaalia sp. ZJ405]QPK82035.1 SHOCT domain-containing protein [Schaalia sp. ZJ405]